MLYGIKPNDRMFVVTKSFLHHEMDRGSKAAGVKRIKIHGLRHSHISHLIDLGFSAVAIADRVGHERHQILHTDMHICFRQSRLIWQISLMRKGVICLDKNLDRKGRWRNIIVSFRMSPQERDDLDIRVKLSGLTKQDYIIKRLLERNVIVQPSSRLFKALRNQMTEILTELKRIENGANVDDELIAVIKTVAETYNSLEEK